MSTTEEARSRGARAVVGLGLLVAAACSSPSAPTGAGSSASSSSNSSSSASATSSASGGAGGATSSSGGGTTSSSSGGMGGADPNALCVETGHAGACSMCCASDNAAGYEIYVGALIQYCACSTGATCFAQCSDPMDLCANPSAQTGSAACIGCVNGLAKTDACFTAMTASVDATCQASPGCAAMVACRAGCAGLPM